MDLNPKLYPYLINLTLGFIVLIAISLALKIPIEKIIFHQNLFSIIILLILGVIFWAIFFVLFQRIVSCSNRLTFILPQSILFRKIPMDLYITYITSIILYGISIGILIYLFLTAVTTAEEPLRKEIGIILLVILTSAIIKWISIAKNTAFEKLKILDYGFSLFLLIVLIFLYDKSTNSWLISLLSSANNSFVEILKNSFIEIPKIGFTYFLISIGMPISLIVADLLFYYTINNLDKKQLCYFTI